MSLTPAEFNTLVADGRTEALFTLLLDQLDGPWNTRKAVRSGWRVLQRFLDERGASLLQPLDADAYQQWLTHEYRGVVASTNNRLTQARKLYALLIAAGVTDTNPFEGQAGQHNPADRRRRAYPPDDVLELLAHSGPEDAVLVLLGAHAGLSGPEVSRLTWAHIDHDLTTITVTRPATPGRSVPCSAELQQALAALAEARGATPLLGQRPSGRVITLPQSADALTDSKLRARIYRICERAGVPYRAWQALRNHAALRFLRTHTRQEVMVLLGVHSLTALLPSIRMQQENLSDS
ncbi:hypothetical protein GCM10008956_12390 [Deinococcus arenae]|uniref:Core-binding (CB) domain-containing protein n=1 Tax=Deinococcus arenae TaxID=1452751 RepID=A0A8H9GQB8_9DEIO|nr:site-specific integrase [Deinococcus arenae]AWT37640.1 hypothetical protein DM785_18275 [Deinococcus actinosclerus]GGM37468.1 hypothetical protein GCM10008956_12390 [Deinococcus arenae]